MSVLSEGLTRACQHERVSRKLFGSWLQPTQLLTVWTGYPETQERAPTYTVILNGRRRYVVCVWVARWFLLKSFQSKVDARRQKVEKFLKQKVTAALWCVLRWPVWPLHVSACDYRRSGDDLNFPADKAANFKNLRSPHTNTRTRNLHEQLQQQQQQQVQLDLFVQKVCSTAAFNSPNHFGSSLVISTAKPKSASFTTAPFSLLASSRFSGCKKEEKTAH